MSSNDPKRPPRPSQLPAEKPDVDRPDHPLVDPEDPETKPDPKPGDRPRPEQPIAPPPPPPTPEPRREARGDRAPGAIPGDTLVR